MEFTNKYGIRSQSTVDALTHDDYDLKSKPDNVYSCTEIIDAPKIKILQSRHKDEIVVDISDRFWTMDGSAIHYVVEMSNKKKGHDRLSEERLYLRIDGKGGKVECFTLNDGEDIRNAQWYNTEMIFVSVKFDQYDYETCTIEDNKRCSVWETIYGLKISRVQQLNIGALGLRLLGFPVKLLRVVMFLKDWKTKEYKQNLIKDGELCRYPKIPYKEYDVVPASIEDSKELMIERANLHSSNWLLKDDDIPECTPEERWYRGEAFAVIKEGNKSATKVFKVDGDVTSEMAQESAANLIAQLMLKDTKAKYRVEHRPGINQRCLEYCEARLFCHFGRNLVEVETEE